MSHSHSRPPEGSSHFKINYYATFTTICVSILFTIIAAGCVITNESLERSVRGVLISFCMVNIVSSSLLIYDIGAYINSEEEYPLDYIVIVTMVLSISHLMLLLLHYHLILTSGRKKQVRDFSGLVLTAWIVSATLGSVNYSLRHDVVKIIIIALFLIIEIVSCVAYRHILQKHREYIAIQQRYKEMYLKIERHETADQLPGQWNLTLLAIILFTYVGCSLPWFFTELLEYLQEMSYLAHVVSLLIYSLNYYIFAIICMVMKFQDQSTTDIDKAHLNRLEQNYRLRRHSYIPYTSAMELGSAHPSLSQSSDPFCDATS